MAGRFTITRIEPGLPFRPRTRFAINPAGPFGTEWSEIASSSELPRESGGEPEGEGKTVPATKNTPPGIPDGVLHRLI